MTSPLVFAFRRHLLMTCAVFATAFGFAHAQGTTAASSEDSPKDDDEVKRLSPFVVKSEKESGYSGQQSLIGSRSAKNLIDIPSNITIINKELLDDLQATSVSQAVRFGVSGVSQNTIYNDDFNIRGYRTEQAMRNGVTKNANRGNPMYDVSRVEVIKGPAAMLTGNNSFLGGAINLVSYEPTAIRMSDIKLTVGDNDYIRVAANTSGPLYKDKDLTIDYRFTVGGLSGDRPKEMESLNEKFIGCGLVAYVGANSTLLLNAYYYRNYGYMYLDDFLDINSTVNARLNQYSTKTFSVSPSKYNFWHGEDSFIDVEYLTKISEHGNVRFYYTGTSIREHRRHLRGITVSPDNYTLNYQDIPFFIEKVSHNLQLDYLHHLSLSALTLDSALGVDGAVTYSRQENSVNTPPSMDTRNPNFALFDAWAAQPQAGVGGLPNTSFSISRPLLLSYYIQENLSFLKDRITLVGGLRWFNPGGTNLNYLTGVVTDRDKTHFKVHKYGLVVKILPTVSAYYTDAGNVFVQTGNTDRFSPGDGLGPPYGNQQGKLKEYGLKFNHKISDRLTIYGSTAHYEMALTNVKTTDVLPESPTHAVGGVNSKQDTSKGVELDFGTRLDFGTGHGDVIITYADGTSTTAINPALQATDFPRRKYSILAKSTWTTGPLKGVMVGGAIMDQSAKREGTYQLDFPLTAAVFAGYQYNEHWYFQGNIDNLTDERYVVGLAASGLAMAADSRTLRLMIGYKF